MQPHALHAAQVHIERVLIEAFNRVIGQADDDDVATLLDDVRSLYTLSAIEQDLGWFVAHGALTSDSTKRIASSVTRLSATLRPNARHLVDAFGIPDEMLAAPIAL